MPADRWFAVGACAGAQERARAQGVDDARREIGRLAAKASGALVAGFCTYGEIARIRGARGFRNQTLVVLSDG
jgi:hypothetical protein